MIFVKQIVPLFAAVATGMGLVGFMAARNFTLNPDVRLATNHPSVLIQPSPPLL
jgi:predicted transcriptional regulator